MDILYGAILALSPAFPTFIIITLTLWVTHEIYESWFRFARWWIPLSMLAIFMAPEYSHDWMFRVEKGSVALAMSATFIIVSIGIIAIKYFSLKRGR